MFACQKRVNGQRFVSGDHKLYNESLYPEAVKALVSEIQRFRVSGEYEHRGGEAKNLYGA